MMGESANRTIDLPSDRTVRPTSDMFEMATRSLGTIRVTENVALNSGSSQHGKARRASAASNCVVAMVCSSPSSSV